MSLTRGLREPIHAFQSRRRLEALRLFQSSSELPLAEIARRVGVTPKYVRRWRDAFLQGDLSFVSASPPGNKRRLTDEQRALIREHILAGPEAAGYPQQVWTQKRIAALIEQLTGVSYHPNVIRTVMMAMDISCQKPVLRASKQSDERKAEFLQSTWTAAKKGP